jgi:hypothetical protein
VFFFQVVPQNAIPYCHVFIAVGFTCENFCCCKATGRERKVLLPDNFAMPTSLFNSEICMEI